MNFSLELKEELIAGAPRKPCCKKAYARGLFLDMAMTRAGGLVLTVPTASARRECARVYRDLYKKEALVDTRRLFFASPELFADLTGSAPQFLCEHCKLHYLRGAMISRGTVTDPAKAYHLEFRLSDAENVPYVAAALSSFGWRFSSRTIAGGGVGLYTKNSTVIEEILGQFPATNALFTLMNAKIARGIRNEENRATNCVTRNINRSVNANAKCLDAVAAIRRAACFDKLPAELRETANLREENPEATLSELAQLHVPPITKSGLNHRIAKIIAFAEELPAAK